MRVLGLATVAGLMLGAAAPASATGFTLTYSGYFNSAFSFTTRDSFGQFVTLSNPGDAFGTAGSPTTFSTPTAFTITGHFDTATVNEVAALNGNPADPHFVAYRTDAATLKIGGLTYTFKPSQDISAAIFDRTSGFGPPGNNAYAAGFLLGGTQDLGIGISEFSTSSTEFTAGNLTDAIFGGYSGGGLGYRNGVFCPGCTAPYNEAAGLTTLLLSDGTSDYELDINFWTGAPRTVDGTPLTFSATLVPEPASMALLGAGLAGIAALRRRRVA